MAGHLVLKYDGKKILLEGQRIKIGRALGKGNDLVIADQQVSSEHLVINNGVLVDPKSTNGTFINDSSEQLPRGEERVLKEGDTITIATYKMTIERDDGTTPAAAPAETAADSKAADSLSATAPKAQLRSWAQHRIARSSTTMATVKSSAFSAAKLLAAQDAAAAAAKNGSNGTAADATQPAEGGDGDDPPVIDDVVEKTGVIAATSDPTRGLLIPGSAAAEAQEAAVAAAVPGVIDDEKLASMSADELRAAYAARANEVRVLTSKLKHKATAARVMFRQNVNSKLEGLNRPVTKLAPNEKDELESLKFQVLYGDGKKDKEIAALERQLKSVGGGGAAPGDTVGGSGAAVAAAANGVDEKAAKEMVAAAEAKVRESCDAKLKELEERIKKHDETSAQWDSERDRFEAKLATAEMETANYKLTIDGLNAASRDAKDAYDIALRDLKKSRGECTTARDDKLKAEKEAAQHRRENKTFEAKLEKLQVETNALRSQLEKANAAPPPTPARALASGADTKVAAASSSADLVSYSRSFDQLRKQIEVFTASESNSAIRHRTALQNDIHTLATRTNQLVVGLVLLFVLVGVLLLSTSS